MDRRRKINVNNYETLTDAELQKVASEYGARVCPKVGLSDALDIKRSGLNRREYSYAIKAHFDFTVVDESGKVAFAVEFDEPHHETDKDAQRRDRLKNAICERLDMPLLRFTNRHLQPIGFDSPHAEKQSFLAGDFSSVVAWVAECWFLEQAFEAAQSRGEVPMTEPFIAQSFFGYDPTINARAYLMEKRKEGELVEPHHDTERYKDAEAWLSLATVYLSSGQAIAGFARCLSLNFSAMSAWELCEELAILEVARRLRKYETDQFTPYSVQEIEEWKQRLNQDQS